jgi:transposase
MLPRLLIPNSFCLPPVGRPQPWKQLDIDVQTITDEIERISNEDALCRRLRQIPGFGRLVSAATVAAIGP